MNTISICMAVVCLALAWTRSAVPECRGEDEAISVSPAQPDAGGFLVHEVRSPYHAGTTQIRVLLPGPPEPARRYPVVFVLPVEAGTESRYGDGLREAREKDLPNRLRAILVAPTFSHLPWYADHPTRPDMRQEAYFLRVVVPFVDRTYPVRAGAAGHRLLGFSKSGWGAYSLLLRHPELFGRAAAWDAPLMMERADRYGSSEIFGTPENFERYRISRLLEERAGQLREGRRLILLGYGNFREHHVRAHALMERLKIAHEYRDGPARKHDWHSGWVSEAAERLLAEDR